MILRNRKKKLRNDGRVEFRCRILPSIKAVPIISETNQHIAYIPSNQQKKNNVPNTD